MWRSIPAVAENETVIPPLNRNQTDLVDTACSAEHPNSGFAMRMSPRGRVMGRFRHQSASGGDRIRAMSSAPTAVAFRVGTGNWLRSLVLERTRMSCGWYLSC